MFMIITLTLLMIEIASIISQNCSPRAYNIVKREGLTLPPNQIISSHTVKSGDVLLECYEFCKKEPTCIGFNYRNTKNVVNCQLTNITGERYHNTMKGEWILLEDVKAAKNDEKRNNESMSSATSCAHLYNLGVRNDGVYTIAPDGLGSFKVSCDMSKDGSGWTVFQRRQDGSQNFFLGWSDYKAGFGNLTVGEFWLGLDKIHRLTKSGLNVLRVDLTDFNDTERYAKYGTFSVANESDKYRLTIGDYSGDADDSLDFHNQMQFTTKDNDNDANDGVNCATRWKGAWWYEDCYRSNLNGLYLDAGPKDATGIVWDHWHYHSLKKTEMKIRPNQF